MAGCFGCRCATDGFAVDQVLPFLDGESIVVVVDSRADHHDDEVPGTSGLLRHRFDARFSAHRADRHVAMPRDLATGEQTTWQVDIVATAGGTGIWIRNSWSSVPTPPTRVVDRLVTAAANVSTPTLLVRGRHSDLVPAESAAELLRLIPSAELVEVDAGHMVTGDDNDVFTERLDASLARLSGAR